MNILHHSWSRVDYKWNIYQMKYAQKTHGGFCFVMVVFTHILQGYFAGMMHFNYFLIAIDTDFMKYGQINHTSL